MVSALASTHPVPARAAPHVAGELRGLLWASSGLATATTLGCHLLLPGQVLLAACRVLEQYGQPYDSLLEHFGGPYSPWCPWWMLPCLHRLGVAFGPADKKLMLKAVRAGAPLDTLRWLRAQGCLVSDWREVRERRWGASGAAGSSSGADPHRILMRPSRR
ncbi:hypothetical protein HYH03_017754 [Edaphochlamys debaryana]|uniref:Uncharacterized protein n=1 Tax=Edaphochlamys debaryana TaxID=47281 RepID=A0A836BP09_9CHLO|nr:hypothetical protein HYH03_017754 [Edaphochlamys debaryana]|eukprot:KAG2483402.1 hypothetical protein HYH03_017754 [Edaphochlamys debaryana]